MCVEEEWTGVPHSRHTASAKSLSKVHVLHADTAVSFSSSALSFASVYVI